MNVARRLVEAPRAHHFCGVDRFQVGADSPTLDNLAVAVKTDGGPLNAEDRTHLGPGVHLHANDAITIGSGCVLADGVYVTSTVTRDIAGSAVGGGIPACLFGPEGDA